MKTPVCCHIARCVIGCTMSAGVTANTAAETLVIDAVQHISPNGVLSEPLVEGQYYWNEVSGIWMRDAVHHCDAEWFEPHPPGSPWEEEYSGYPGLLDLQINLQSPDWYGYVDGNRELRRLPNKSSAGN